LAVDALKGAFSKILVNNGFREDTSCDAGALSARVESVPTGQIK
jgi:hypothetical protein